jgi:hypothetical protein
MNKHKRTNSHIVVDNFILLKGFIFFFVKKSTNFINKSQNKRVDMELTRLSNGSNRSIR